ncbi:MAG: isocitrate dehydrogenase, NAD-dependent [Phycisphaerae bacterium]|nr:MAG: isocitrate dehydrogenase, NAD-dependent [Phycisphaerae bacterium]
MAHTVCLIPGDGIGPEVAQAARDVLDATNIGINWVELAAGAAALETHGAVLPEETVQSIDAYRVALKGPITTPIGKGFTSVNVGLRRRLNLFAAVRPVRSMPGVKTRYENVDLVVIRENTEGLYSGIENEVTPGVVQSLKIATREACWRIAKFALNYAVERERKRVTMFHKANIMKLSDGLFLECAHEAHEKFGTGIELDELIVDNGCMQLVSDPTRFDIVLMENLYGDIVSDLCAGLVGGLGVVPGANIGKGCAVFEAVHGSAPTIAGQNVANPLALIMSGAMMLNHLGETDAAERMKNAYDAVLEEGNPEEITADIGGKGTTSGFAKAIIARM